MQRDIGVSRSYNQNASFTNSTDARKCPPNSLASDAMKRIMEIAKQVSGIFLMNLLLTVHYLSKHHYHEVHS